MTRPTLRLAAFRLSASIAALACLQCAPAAFAAEAAAADEAAAEGGTSDGLTEIVVTATKRETNLQKTPIAISVLGSEDIKRRQIQSLGDLADGGVPSLRIATYESRQTALTIGIRGIVPGDANQPAREAGVGVYIDGVYLGRQHGLNATLFDVERIEVLKGPQGTLFGRNTEGGALSIITKAPTGEFGGRVSVGVGNYGSYTGGLHLNLPEFANLSVKLDAVIDHGDETTKNPLQGEKGWNFHHRYGGRIAVRWKPSSTFTADLAYDNGRDENTPYYSQLLNYNPNGLPVATLAELATVSNNLNTLRKIAPLSPLVVISGERQDIADIGVPQQVSLGKAEGVMGVLKWKVSDDIELRSITAYRTVASDQWDNSGGAHRTPVFLPNAAFSRYSLSDLDSQQFSQELQAVGSLGSVDYVLGLYYFDESAEEVAATPNTNTWNATGTAFTINNPLTWQRANWTIARASRAKSKSYAAFTHLNWQVSDTLQLTVGGRYTHDDKTGVLYNVNNVATNFQLAFKGNRFDPMVSIGWRAAPDINLYAKYSTGYRAGGASSRSTIFRVFGPETVDAFEVGAKTELFDRRVRFNVAAYMMNRKNTQFDFDNYAPIAGGLFRHNLETINAGDTKIRGIEADLTIRPTDNLSASLSYAYTYWKTTPAINPLISGSTPQQLFVVYTPPHALSGSLDYSLPLGTSSDKALKLHIDANYAARQYSFDNEPVLSEPSFIVNARLSLADIPMSDSGQKMTIAVWARNLFNESHIYRRSNANSVPLDGTDFRTVLGDYANFNPPRTFGIDATVSF